MGGENIGVSQDALVSSNYKKLPQYIATICATLGAFSLGCALAWTSPAETTIRSNSSSDEYSLYNVHEEQWSWVSSLMPLGGAAVSYPIGYSVDIIGRRTSMLALVVPFLLSWGFIVKPTSLGMLMAGRFILGMAGGAFAVAAPMYTGEIAHKDIRGALGSYFQLMVTFGILFIYALGTGVKLWIISLICFIIPIVFGVSFFFMPESPYYFVMKGKTEEAEKALKYFRGKHYDVSKELEEMEQQYKISQEGSFSKTMKSTAAKKAMAISLCLMFIQQFSGVNAVIMYTTKIFHDADVSMKPAIATLMVGIFQFVATFVSTIIIDKAGRRILLLISSSVMCISALFVAVYFTVDESKRDNIAWLPILGLCLFIVVFSLGFGPIPWMILGELFPSRVKGFASSTAACFNWILAFIVTKFYGNIEQGIGTGMPFWIFTAVLAAGFIFVIIFVPETKGKTLTEIQEMLGEGKKKHKRRGSSVSST